MKSRLTLIFAALVVLIAAMICFVIDRPTAAPIAMAVEPAVAVRVVPAPAPAAEQYTIPATAPAVSPLVVATPVYKSSPMVRIDPAGNVDYTARFGDTVSQLAIALLGSDSKENRDAVIAANPPLQSNPDRVILDQIYSMPASSIPGKSPAAGQSTPATTPAATSASIDQKTVKTAVIDDSPKLKYTAQAGDTVGALAANLLGADTKTNRQSIVAGNTSLQQNPDHLVAGQSYTIAVPNGLAADPNVSATPAPTTQPDADELARLSVGRTLRYTAQPGDTVSNLAVALLGSDTAANRELITKSNPALKQDPDHLIAGQTYWINAPTIDPAR